MSDEEDYLDNQAGVGEEEADDEEVEDEEGEGELVEEEAEDGEGDEDAEADSSEEEEEGQDEYEADGFIVNEDEEVEEEEEGGEDGSDGEQEKKKKKKKKKRKAEFLPDEEDIALLRDAGVAVKDVRRLKHRRLKQRIEDEDEDAIGSENLEQRLFGKKSSQGLEDELEEGAAEEQADKAEEEEDDFLGEDSEDEMGDFLDDGEEGGKRRKRRRRAVPSFLTGLDPEALQDANAMLDFTTLPFYKELSKQQQQLATVDDEGDAEEMEEETLPSDADDDRVADFHNKKEQRQRERRMKRLLAMVDPETVAARFLSPEDQRITERDMPERMQLLGKLMDEKISCDDAAAWVYKRVFYRDAPKRLEKELVERGILEVEGPQTPSATHSGRCLGLRDNEQEKRLLGRRLVREPRNADEILAWQDDSVCQRKLTDSLRDVLQRFNVRYEEVPYVAMFRKDECGELLAMRKEDRPLVTGPNDNTDFFVPGTVQAKHRRIRRWDVLWCVYEWGLKFRQLIKRKEARAASYRTALAALRENMSERAMTATQMEEAEQMVSVLEGCINALGEASTTEELDDIDAKFRLVVDALPGNERELLASLSLEGGSGMATTKRPQRTTKYSLQRALGLGRLVAAMTMSAEKLGENLDELFRKHDAPEIHDTPDNVAKDYLDQGLRDHGLQDSDQVLKAAKAMAAQELAAEPVVRRFLRQQFYQKAKLDTKPTPSGESVLEPTHKYGFVKRLQGKDLFSLEATDTFLRIHMAEKEGLITSKIQVPQSELESSIVEEMCEYYLGDSVSIVGKEWNRHRREILQAAILEHLMPVLEREFRARALAEAREVALKNCADKFWSLASGLPLQLYDIEANAFIELPKVMAICWGPGPPITMAVMLDMHGNLKDLLPLPQLSGNIPRGRQIGEERFQDPRKSRDLEKLREFVRKHGPNEIFVGCSAPACKQLHEEVVVVVEWLKDYDSEWIAQLDTKHIGVHLADESMAKLWENCGSAREELGEHAQQVRRAVGLARSQLDPLAVLSALCGPRREVLSLQLHELQPALPADDVYAVVQQMMVTAVNQVGVDINAVVAIPWKTPALQFAAGLGPRKAAALVKDIAAQENYVENRSNLFNIHIGKQRKTVFRNCAAFLRVRNPELNALSNIDFRLLDNTRLHPELYSKIVADMGIEVLRITGEYDGEADHYNVCRDVMDGKPEHISAIEELDLHRIAEESESLGRMALLVDVQMEFLAPYGEIREVVPELNALQQFMLMYGETLESLKPGRLVEARVRFVNADEVRCQLMGSGADAVILRDNISSGNTDSVRLGDRVKPDQVLTARILEVTEMQGRDGQSTCVVSLTTRSADLADRDHYWEQQYCSNVDEAYVIQSEADRQEAADAARRAAAPKTSFTQRPIRHALFQNISGNDAIKLLAGMAAGSSLFRPSSRGVHSLTLSMKICDTCVGGMYVHVDLKETRKPNGGPLALKLGTPLVIDIIGKGPTNYDDLDEVLARYVTPYLNNVASITSHPKYHDAQMHGVEELLKQERAQLARQGTTQAVYRLAIDERKPGTFCIVFVTSQTPHHEYFVPTPDGFYFRKKVHSSVDRMLSEFKRSPGNPEARAQNARAAGGYQQRPTAWGPAPYAMGGAASQPYGGYAANPYAAAGGAAYGGYPSASYGGAPYAPSGGYVGR